MFISLTNEGERSVQRVRDFTRQAGIRWLSGWGVTSTIEQLGTEYLPTNYVIGSDGKVFWSSASSGRLDNAVERALVLAGSKSGA